MGSDLEGGWTTATIVAAIFAATVVATTLAPVPPANAAEHRHASPVEQQASRAERPRASEAEHPRASEHRPVTESVASHSTTSPGAGQQPDASFASASSPTADEKLLLDLVNVERTTRGLRPLAWDGTLTVLARLHGADMRSVGKASHHSSRDGADFGGRLARTSYRAQASAENVAYNADVVKAHRALMASAGHRHNILDPTLTALGTAVIFDTKDDWIYVVEDFAIPIQTVTDAEAAQKIRESLSHARGRWRSNLAEDAAMSRHLGGLLEQMIATGSVRDAIGGGVGEGWTLAFTSMDPSQPPPSVREHVGSADGYALAVSFRKTPKYPFGTYWAILYLKGAS